MIVTCPSCGKKYRIPEEKLHGKSRKLRCKSCHEVFVVHPPKKEQEKQHPEVVIDEQAARFARVLASDMLVYNKDTVEKGRESGDLPDALAGEIERSWQLWKNRFPKAAASEKGVAVFRESLNEILAGGRGLFDGWKPE